MPMPHELSRAMNARNRSTKSWSIREFTPQAPLLFAELPDFEDPHVDRQRLPVGAIVAIVSLPGTIDPHLPAGASTRCGIRERVRSATTRGRLNGAG